MAQEYEQTQVVAASPEEVFAWVSDVGNMPKYLPPIKEASIEGESASGTPGERVRLRGEIPDRGEFDGEVTPARTRVPGAWSGGRGLPGLLRLAHGRGGGRRQRGNGGPPVR